MRDWSTDQLFVSISIEQLIDSLTTQPNTNSRIYSYPNICCCCGFPSHFKQPIVNLDNKTWSFIVQRSKWSVCTFVCSNSKERKREKEKSAVSQSKREPVKYVLTIITWLYVSVCTMCAIEWFTRVTNMCDEIEIDPDNHHTTYNYILFNSIDTLFAKR